MARFEGFWMKCVRTLDGGQQGTILIVDDDVEDRRFAQCVIASVYPQLRVMGLHSGEELICYLQGEHGYSDRTNFPYPILILLDLRMPGMHGFHVLGWLREHSPHNLIPVVVLTASGEVMVTQQAYALGARSFLTKPIGVNDFRETMGKFEDRTACQCEECLGSPPSL
jgi:CheY-like chemotaxis protein